VTKLDELEAAGITSHSGDVKKTRAFVEQDMADIFDFSNMKSSSN
jgi:hypothetical protein